MKKTMTAIAAPVAAAPMAAAPAAPVAVVEAAPSKSADELAADAAALRSAKAAAAQQEADSINAASKPVDPSIAPNLDEEATDELADSTYAESVAPIPQFLNAIGGAARPGGGAPVSKQDETSRLNPKYTFDTFVAGSSNKLAHAAAVATAEMPARAYNPLFIYGESGLGKTHLLHAIGAYAQELYGNVRVKYVSSEEFTNDFINSIRDDKASVFQKRYRDLDILLVDDIQFLIDNLPDGCRMIFNLYAIEGYKHQEIAVMLGINEGTSKSQLSHARKLLQEQITKLKNYDNGTE